MPESRASTVPRGMRRPLLLACALLLAAVNLRTAVTSVGPLLDVLQREIGLSSPLAGVLTTLPLTCFAVFGALTPRIAHRFGEQQTLAGALALMTAGLFLRVLVHSAWPFLVLSVPALVGGAIGNVLLPVLVKRDFPNHLGGMTAAYTTAIAIGGTVGAAATVPLGSLGRGVDWRIGLGAWGVLATPAAALWLGLAWHAGPRDGDDERVKLPMRRSRTAWMLALFFAAQSLQGYVAFGWFALFFRERAGASPTRAGLLVAVLAAMAIPISMVVPGLAARLRTPRPLVVAVTACYGSAYIGMLTAPRSGEWLWMVLTGVGNGAFPLSLTMISLRSRTSEGTVALSAFTQSIGYVLSGAGPLLVGVLHGSAHHWTASFTLLFIALAVLLTTGWYAAGQHDVEDELRPRRKA